MVPPPTGTLTFLLTDIGDEQATRTGTRGTTPTGPKKRPLVLRTTRSTSTPTSARQVKSRSGALQDVVVVMLTATLLEGGRTAPL